MTDARISTIATAYQNWTTLEKLSRVVTLAEVHEADYNLSPSQFVDVSDKVTHRPMSDILQDLEQAKQLREQADTELAEVLMRLGYDEMPKLS